MRGGPAATIPLEEREAGRTAIANADGLVASSGFIWVKTDDGRVVQVDPQDNRVLRSLKLDTVRDPHEYCQGLGADESSIWVCARNEGSTDVVQLDPTTLRPLRRLPVDKAFDQLRLPFSGGRIWVLSDEGRTALAIQPATGMTARYPLPVRCLQLAGSDTVLVATCRTENTVLRLDPASGSVLTRATVPAPGIAAIAGEAVWVDSSSGVLKLDRKLHRVLAFADVQAGLGGDLVVDGSSTVWVRQEAGFLLRIDTSVGTITERVAPAQTLSGGSLLVTPEAVWTTASDDGLLIRLSR